MDEIEARAILDATLAEIRARSLTDLLPLLVDGVHREVRGTSGAEYQVELNAVWDDKGRTTLRVMASIDDGGWRAIVPITFDVLVPVVIRARSAAPPDLAMICAIYNEGVEDRIATFETDPREPDQIAAWLGGRHPVVVAEADERVVAFAAAFAYRTRSCYDGVAEFSVYAERAWRGKGAGRAALTRLIAEAEAAGFWKLVSRVFPENTANLRLLATLGFREVGIYRKHARLDGRWRDVVVVERLIEAPSSRRSE